MDSFYFVFCVLLKVGDLGSNLARVVGWEEPAQVTRLGNRWHLITHRGEMNVMKLKCAKCCAEVWHCKIGLPSAMQMLR